MAIQVTPPEKIGFSRNPIVWRFQNDNAGYLAGSVAENAIIFSGAVVPGTTIVVRWNGEEQKLKASATPSSLGAEFPAGDGSVAYVESLVEWFAANYYFNEYFVVVTNTIDELPALVFQGRKAGSSYNFSKTTFAGGECRNTVSGVNSTIPVNPHVYVEVWVRKGVDLSFDRIYQAPLALTTDSNAELDLNEILHAELTPEMPSMILPMGSHVHGSRLDYYLKYAPAGGENFSVGQLLQTDTYYALLGGTSYEAGSGATVASTVLGLTPALDRFLSLQNTTRYVYRDQPAFLSFINLREESRTAATLRITVHFQDETTQVVDNTGVTNLHQYQKAMWAVGYNQLNLAALNTDKVVQQYTAQLFDGATAISEQLSFVVLYDYKPYRRYFAYVNSVGGIDTLSICGKGSPELTYFREQAEQVLPYNYESHHGQYTDWDIEVQESFDAATGFLRAQDFLTFRDFFRSTHKYRVVAVAAYPIGITTNSIRESRDGDNARALLFQYTYLFRNRSVSLGDLEKDSFEANQNVPPPGIEGAGPIVVGNSGLPYTGQVDPYPIPASLNPVTSGGVFELLSNYQPKFSVGTTQQIRLGDGSLANIQTLVRSNQEHRSATTLQRGELRLATLSEARQGVSEEVAITPKTLKDRLDEFEPNVENLPIASQIQLGIVQLATDEEAAAGTDNSKAITPKQLKEELGSIDQVVDLPSNQTIAGLKTFQRPDGEKVQRWLNESGEKEIYVQFSEDGTKMYFVPLNTTEYPGVQGFSLYYDFTLERWQFEQMPYFGTQPINNGGEALKLATPVFVSLTGDAEAQAVEFDGSENLTLPTSVPVARHPKFGSLPQPFLTVGEGFNIVLNLGQYITSHHAAADLKIESFLDRENWCNASYDGLTVTLTGTYPSATGKLPRILVREIANAENQRIITLPEPTITNTPPVVRLEYWNESAGSKLADITESAVLTWINPWDTRWIISNAPHNYWQIITRNNNTGTMTERVSLAGTVAQTSQTTLHGFGAANSSTVTTVNGQPLAPGSYTQQLILKRDGETIVDTTVSFSIQEEMKTCERGPTLFGNNPITNITNTSLTYAFDGLGANDHHFRILRDGQIQYASIARSEVLPDLYKDAFMQIEFPYQPGGIYRLEIEGANCRSAVSWREFTIPGGGGEQPGTPTPLYLKKENADLTYTTLAELSTTEATLALPDNWEVFFTGADGKSFDYVTMQLFDVTGGSEQPVNVSTYTGAPQVYTFSSPTASANLQAFLGMKSTQIGSIHRPDSKFRIVWVARSGGASGTVVATKEARFAFLSQPGENCILLNDFNSGTQGWAELDNADGFRAEGGRLKFYAENIGTMVGSQWGLGVNANEYKKIKFRGKWPVHPSGGQTQVVIYFATSSRNVLDDEQKIDHYFTATGADQDVVIDVTHALWVSTLNNIRVRPSSVQGDVELDTFSICKEGVYNPPPDPDPVAKTTVQLWNDVSNGLISELPEFSNPSFAWNEEWDVRCVIQNMAHTHMTKDLEKQNSSGVWEKQMHTNQHTASTYPSATQNGTYELFGTYHVGTYSSGIIGQGNFQPGIYRVTYKIYNDTSLVATVTRTFSFGEVVITPSVGYTNLSIY
ncbi:hypothetical protein [Telluribacter humicola]|uniref:hypothetical protein n=1 Tax=Telluribacter humicola TaxID=1720261 RepID=UPI001A965E9A|nr:hypothetical protein [Telluribacter humicola]